MSPESRQKWKRWFGTSHFIFLVLVTMFDQMLNVSPFEKCFLTTNSNKVKTLSEPLGSRKYSTRAYNKTQNKLLLRMFSSRCSQNSILFVCFINFLLWLSSRDKAGIFLFALQIRNNAKLASGLSKKRGEHKVFFHVTLESTIHKNFPKQTLAILLYYYIL